MAIDPNVKMMADKMQAMRPRPNPGQMPMQRPTPEQEGPQEDQSLAQVKMHLQKAMELLNAMEG